MYHATGYGDMYNVSIESRVMYVYTKSAEEETEAVG
jgi:hypothetical protein